MYSVPFRYIRFRNFHYMFDRHVEGSKEVLYGLPLRRYDLSEGRLSEGRAPAGGPRGTWQQGKEDHYNHAEKRAMTPAPAQIWLLPQEEMNKHNLGSTPTRSHKRMRTYTHMRTRTDIDVCVCVYVYVCIVSTHT